MPSFSKVHSDLMPLGIVSWTNMKTNRNGQVDVKFNTNWNELIQGLSTIAIYEFQGWARTVSYIKNNGIYIISCQGIKKV